MGYFVKDVLSLISLSAFSITALLWIDMLGNLG